MTDRVWKLPEIEPGSVWLVGAGPGDPGLLTLYAHHALRTADAVVYDALVNKDVLALADTGAVLEYAGKRGGKPSPHQADISRRLVALARQGRRVLRLKGGDPYVFGRGAEEVLALVAAQVPFRVVPGISSGLGGLAYAGIPLTHRETNSVVTLVTAHDAGGAVPDSVDWEAVARCGGSIVVYMPLKNLAVVARRIIAAGRPSDEPAAIVSKATLAAQRVLETTLGRAAVDAAEAQLEPPALFVVGAAVRLRAGLDWIGAASGRILNPDPLGVRAQSEAG